MEKGARKYGLIISSKKKQATKSVKQLSAFAESSSDDEVSQIMQYESYSTISIT